MRSRIVVWLMLLALIAPITCLSAEKGDAAKGKEVFRRCAVCHGDTGEGREAIAKAYGVTMKPFSSKEVQSMNDAALKKGILEGRGKMKPVILSDAEVADVIAYLRTLKK